MSSLSLKKFPIRDSRGRTTNSSVFRVDLLKHASTSIFITLFNKPLFILVDLHWNSNKSNVSSILFDAIPKYRSNTYSPIILWIGRLSAITLLLCHSWISIALPSIRPASCVSRSFLIYDHLIGLFLYIRYSSQTIFTPILSKNYSDIHELLLGVFLVLQ